MASSEDRRIRRTGTGHNPSATRRNAQRSSAAARSSSARRSSAGGSSRPRNSRPSSSAQRSSAAGARRPAANRRPTNGRRPASGRRPAAGRRPQAKRPRQPIQLSRNMMVVAGVAALLVVLLLHHFLRFRVTVNGEKATVWRGATIEKLLDKGLADPKPGNLLAVDGAILTEGGGDRCSAEIDGTPAAIDARVHRGAVVTIGDGKDVTEDAKVTEEVIPYGTSDSSREFGDYWTGSIHLLSDGEDGVRTVSTGKVSGKTVSEVTKPPVDSGYKIYTAKPKDKVIALTFDDGPWPEQTDQILDILEENNAKATFFTIGNQISEEPDAVKRAHEMGCEVCTHSWDHAGGSGGGVDLTAMSSAEQLDEIKRGYQAIAEVLGEEPPHVIRAPGGNFYGSIIDTLWGTVDAEIGWDVDTEDWRLPGADAIASRILSVQPGQVILMHDGGGDRSQTVEGLRIALPQLVEQGYSFVTVDELIAYGAPDGVIDVG